ncbi:MAG: hypothetical protein ACRENT_04435 [Thermodesulfobacteriota bacterium]
MSKTLWHPSTELTLIPSTSLRINFDEVFRTVFVSCIFKGSLGCGIPGIKIDKETNGD